MLQSYWFAWLGNKISCILKKKETFSTKEKVLGFWDGTFFLVWFECFGWIWYEKMSYTWSEFTYVPSFDPVTNVMKSEVDFGSFRERVFFLQKVVIVSGHANFVHVILACVFCLAAIQWWPRRRAMCHAVTHLDAKLSFYHNNSNQCFIVKCSPIHLCPFFHSVFSIFLDYLKTTKFNFFKNVSIKKTNLPQFSW